MFSFLRRSPTLGIALVALIIFLPACTNQKVVKVGSHKVTVARHGREEKFKVGHNSTEADLEYEGVSNDRKEMKVLIRGDKIIINGVEGTLRPGDSVLIGDAGVAVNAMDYGESEKYLRANSAAAEATSVN